MSDNNKGIQIITGDGSELNISPVYHHIKNVGQPKKKKNKNEIVVPKEKNKKKEKNQVEQGEMVDDNN